MFICPPLPNSRTNLYNRCSYLIFLSDCQLYLESRSGSTCPVAHFYLADGRNYTHKQDHKIHRKIGVEIYSSG